MDLQTTIKPVTAAATAAVTQQLVLNEIAVPVLGAQLTVFLAGAIGALASTLYRDPEEKRSRLFGTIVVATIMGPVTVVLLQHGLWKWVANVQGPLAIVLSFVIRLWLPAIVERGRVLIKKATLPWLKTDGEPK